MIQTDETASAKGLRALAASENCSESNEVGMGQGGGEAARSQICWALWTMVRTLDLLLSEREPL